MIIHTQKAALEAIEEIRRLDPFSPAFCGPVTRGQAGQPVVAGDPFARIRQ